MGRGECGLSSVSSDQLCIGLVRTGSRSEKYFVPFDGFCCLLLISLIRHIHPDPYQQYILYKLSVRLGDSLKLILLLDGVRVGRSLGGVDELIGETLGDGL